MEQYNWITKDQTCWIQLTDAERVKTGECFEASAINQVDQMRQVVKIVDNNGYTKEISYSRLQMRPEDPDTCDDMVNLQCLNEAELLQTLRLRFADRSIYTLVGPTLISMNPYQVIPNLYTEEMMQRYLQHILAQIKGFEAGPAHALPPHVFKVTVDSYNDLFANDKKQAIVISGESGAGKTENTKYCMKVTSAPLPA